MNQCLLLWEQSSKYVSAENIANPKAQEGVGQAKLGQLLHGHLDLYKTGLDIKKKKKQTNRTPLPPQPSFSIKI